MADESKAREIIARINDLRHQLEVVEARFDELENTTNDRALAEGRRLRLRQRMNELADAAKGSKDEIERLKSREHQRNPRSTWSHFCCGGHLQPHEK